MVTSARKKSICYPYKHNPLEAQAPFDLSVMACHSLQRTQANPLYAEQKCVGLTSHNTVYVTVGNTFNYKISNTLLLTPIRYQHAKIQVHGTIQRQQLAKRLVLGYTHFKVEMKRN